MSYLELLFVEAMVILGFLCALALVPRIIMERRQAGAAVAWLMAVCLFPYLGVPLYLIFGGRRVERVRARKQGPHLETDNEAASAGDIVDESAWDVASLMLRSGATPPLRDNGVTVIGDGERAYDEILEAINNAERRIEVCTYILGRDRVGTTIVSRLARKARQGVEVKLLIDSLGSIWTRRHALRKLRAAGGEVGWFLPMVHFRRRAAAHLRNHRKLIVIDDRVAFVGGMNLSAEYMGPPTARTRWRDVLVRLEGPAVAELHHVFNADWTFTTDAEPRKTHVDSSWSLENAGHGDSIVQVTPDGPDIRQNPIGSGITAAVARARERVWIVTPYFVPDESFSNMLELAARLGRDVRIIIPRRTKIRTADLACRSYLDSLIEAGASVFVYDRSFLHAKLLVVDDMMAGVGSFNVDVRSFHLNFEIGAFLYDEKSVRKIAETVADIQADATPLDTEEFARRSGSRRFLEDTCRLLSPLL